VRFSTRLPGELYDKKAAQLSADFENLFPGKNSKLNSHGVVRLVKQKTSLLISANSQKHPMLIMHWALVEMGSLFSVIAAQIITDHILGNRNEEAEIFSFDRKSG